MKQAWRPSRCGDGCISAWRAGATVPLYGQRWQSETVNSMMKRNLGSALRARTTVHRRHELLLRVLTYNIMPLAEG